MAEIKDFSNHSTIQIRKDIHFVFGSLSNGGTPVEKIKASISEFRKYYEAIGEDAPNVEMLWKNAKEGDWVISDDYRVIQILKRTENKVKGAYNKAVIRSCVGTFAVNKGTFFDTDFKLHKDRYRISTTGQEVAERMITRENATTNEITFAKRVAKGDTPPKAYMRTFSTKNESYAKDMSRLLMKQERVQNNISSEIEQLLEREGVSKTYIIQKYKELIDDGMLDLKNCSGSVRAALSDLVNIAGMKPEKTTSSQSMGVLQEVEDDLLDEIQDVEYKVIEDRQEREDDFVQEFTDKPQEHSIKKEFEQVGDNLLTKAGMDLLS